MTLLTNDQFRKVTRYHFGVGPRPVGQPHVSVSDIGRKQFDYITGWWRQFGLWMAWVDGGKRGPRPPVWKQVSPFAQTLHAEIRAKYPLHPKPPPPPPPPHPPLPPGSEHLQNVSVGAWDPMAALAWPGCKIWFTADPDFALRRHVTAENARVCRDQGHEVGVWYVPDQVEHHEAAWCADVLGTDIIACDCETLGRMQRAVANGVKYGIANLSALFDDPWANQQIASGQFVVMNEFYWNQGRARRPDNHYLPVASLCVAVYDGHSDSTEDAWEPHIADYKAAGYWWQTMSVYQQNMKPEDWAAMPRIG